MAIARRLNGWLGVFVVLITFYAFAVGAIAIATAPKESNIMSAWSWEVLGVLESDVKRTLSSSAPPPACGLRRPLMSNVSNVRCVC